MSTSARGDFGGEWGDKGFASYGKGQKVALADWRLMLGKLDSIRTRRRMSIVLLIHTKVKNFKNPEGADYDRYQPDMSEEAWAVADRWADITLFGNYSVTVEGVKAGSIGAKKGKGVGGTVRLVHTQRTAAYDAKNRIGLPEEFELGDSPAEGWTNFMQAVKEGRKVQ